ncbi:Formamidopyrimidine-DNA glycosylase [Clostridiaceae bacterium JG1575]|nr:Formamidopyrimidine-DNA glycosylase [Clostridiaceae bacterium JG1575]
MPELPEVQTIATALHAALCGKIIEAVRFDVPRSFPQGEEGVRRLIGQRIDTVHREGKAILLELSCQETLLIHLRMTGQLLVTTPQSPESLKETLPNSSTRMEFSLSKECTLWFNDTRRFGQVTLLTPLERTLHPYLSTLGPDPLDPEVSAKTLETILQRRPTHRIKPALLDQHNLAGLGNIYCDEALFLAGIHPERRVGSLSSAELHRLFESIREVLTLSLSKGGSTRRDYRLVDGKEGRYLEEAFVYGRTGAPCRRCNTPIEKSKVSGRGTHFCPRCQSLGQEAPSSSTPASKGGRNTP